MGYRSTIITDHWAFTFSEEFVKKYEESYFFGENGSLPISSKFEVKRYNDDLEEDIIEELSKQNSNHRIYAVWLHEDGLIDRIVFTKEGIFDYEEYLKGKGL